jgi:hypothetical protein
MCDATHIGIFRELRGKNNIESRIKKGRRISYVLLGAGLHEENGINPYISYKLHTTFCRPRMNYALEAIQLLEGEKLELLRYERKLLKQLQSLPERCVTLATYVLLGAKPITTVIEKNTLNAFYNIARHEDFIEHEIARSQLAIKDENSNSWFTYIRKLLQKYNLPTAYEIMGNPLTKGQWKELLNKEIDKYWKNEWEVEKQGKSSLKYLTIQENHL